MNFSKIVLFSTLCVVLTNNNVFSSSNEQSFNTMSTNYITDSSNLNEITYQYFNSRNTTEQISNANNKCCEYIIIDNNNKTTANIPSKTHATKTLTSYKKIRSQTINPSVTIKQKDNLLQNIDEYNKFKSDSKLYNNKKIEQQADIYSYSDIFSDSYSDDDDNIGYKHNNVKSIQAEATSRKSTGISPSQTTNNLEDYSMQNKVSSNQTDNKNKSNNTPEKIELLTNKEKRTIQYIKDNVLNNKSKSNSSINLNTLKQSNINMTYINVNSNEQKGIKKTNNISKSKTIVQNAENSSKFVTEFIKNTETMHGVYDPVYYNKKFNMLNEHINKLKLKNTTKEYTTQQNIVFNDLKELLNNLLTKEFDFNKNTAIENYYNTCILNCNSNNNMKNTNKEANPINIVNYFYNIQFVNNDVIKIDEVQNKFKNINLEYKNEHIINIIEIFEQWKNIYNKYNNLYKDLKKELSTKQEQSATKK